MVRKSCPPPCAAQQRYGEVGKNPRLSLAFFMPPVLHRMTAFFLIRRHKDVKTPFSLTASFSTQREKTDSIQITSFIYVKNTTFIRLLRFFMLTDLGQKTRFHRAGHLFPVASFLTTYYPSPSCGKRLFRRTLPHFPRAYEVLKYDLYF